MEVKREDSFELNFKTPKINSMKTSNSDANTTNKVKKENNKNGQELLNALYPVIIVIRFFGFLPVRMTKDGLEFRWLSIPFLYFLLTTVYSIYLSMTNFSLQNQLPALLLGAGAGRSSSPGPGSTTTAVEDGAPVVVSVDVDTAWGNETTDPITGPITWTDDGGGSAPGLEFEFIGFQLVKMIINIINSFLFQTLFFIGLFIGRKFPLYYSTLSTCFHSFVTDPVRLSQVIGSIKLYTVQSLGFYGLLMIVNLVFVTMDSLLSLSTASYHPLMYSAYFLWQFWYASHVLCCIFSTLLIIVLKFSIIVFNERIQKLFRLRRQDHPSYGITYDTLTSEEVLRERERELNSSTVIIGNCAKTPRKERSRSKVNKGTFDLDAVDTSYYYGPDTDNYFGHIVDKKGDSFCITNGKSKSMWMKDVDAETDTDTGVGFGFEPSDEDESDLTEQRELFYEEFRELKLSYILMEELINSPGFFASSFVFIEGITAVLHVVSIIVIPFTNSTISSCTMIFQTFLHSFFVFRLILNASDLSNEARKSFKIMASASFKEIPSEAHAEVQVFICKLLSQRVLAISIWGVKINQLLLNGLKRIGLILLNLGLLLGYIVWAVITMFPSSGSDEGRSSDSDSDSGPFTFGFNPNNDTMDTVGGNKTPNPNPKQTDVDYIVSLMNRVDLIKQFFANFK